MELVAAQSPRRLLFKQGSRGVVVQVQPDGSAVRYPPFNFQSIIARGYWETPESQGVTEAEGRAILESAVEAPE